MTPTPPSRRVDIGETLLALGAIVFGILIVWQTTLIRLTPAYSKVGPRVIPYIVGAGLVIVGAWLAYEALTGRAVTGSAESEDADLSCRPTGVYRSPGAGAARLPAPHRAGRVHHRQRDPLRHRGLRHGQPAPRPRYRHRYPAGDSPLSCLHPRPRLVVTGRDSGGDRLGGRDERPGSVWSGVAGDAGVALQPAGGPRSHLCRLPSLPTSRLLDFSLAWRALGDLARGFEVALTPRTCSGR